MDLQRNTVVTIALFITFAVSCRAVALKKTNPRFPAIAKMTQDSHPMLAALFNIASAAQKSGVVNKLDTKGGGSTTGGSKISLGDKKIIGDNTGTTFLEIGASLMCQLCREKNDLECINIHCVNDGASSAAVQPGPVLNGVSLPIGISADTPSFINTETANVPPSGISKTTDKQSYPKTFGEFMKMKKYQGRPEKKQVPSAVLSPSKSNTAVLNRPIMGTTKTQTYPKTFGEFIKTKKYQGRPGKKQVPSAVISPPKPNIAVINQPTVNTKNTPSYPKTFGDFMKMKKYQGRPEKKQGPSAAVSPQKPNTAVINRPNMGTTKTQPYPKTFGDFVKMKKYQGRSGKEHVPSDVTSQLKPTQRRVNSADVPRQTMSIQHLVNLETTLYNLLQGKPALPVIGSGQEREPVNGKDVKSKLVKPHKNALFPKTPSKFSGFIDMYNKKINSAKGNSKTIAPLPPTPKTKNTFGTNNNVAAIEIPMLSAPNPPDTFGTINTNAVPFAPLTNKASIFGTRNNDAILIPPASNPANTFSTHGTFGTSGPGVVQDIPATRSGSSFGTVNNDVMPVFPATHQVNTFGTNNNGVISGFPATHSDSTFGTNNNDVIPVFPGTHQVNTFGTNNNDAISGFPAELPFGTSSNAVVPVAHATHTRGTHRQRDMGTQTNTLEMPQTGPFQLDGLDVRDSFSHINHLPVSVSFGVPLINGQQPFNSIQRPRNMHPVASAGVPDVFARKKLRHQADGLTMQDTTLPTTTLRTLSPRRRSELSRFSRHFLPSIK